MGFTPDKYYTVLNAANCIKGYEIDDGFNNLTSCDQDIYIEFIEIRDIFAFIDRGPCFREVIIPDESPIINTHRLYFENDNFVDAFYAKKLYLGNINIWTPENVIDLINNGADVSVRDFFIVKWALINNFKIFYFLQEYICAQDESTWEYIINKLYQEGML